METGHATPSWTYASALAILVSAAGADRFAPHVRLHDRALFELREIATGGSLGFDTTTWRFVPSANGGYAVVGLADAFLILSEEGWLKRDPVSSIYVVSPEFHEWGSRELAGLSGDQRRRVNQVARRWKARARVASKKAA